MANCIHCGRALPSFTLGRAHDTCADCRTAAAINPDFASPTPAPTAIQAVRQKYPPLTTALVAINIAVFVAMVATGVSITEPTSEQLLKWGADWGPLSLSTQPWRMLTSNYLHVGIIHIFFNMWCLWNLGHLAERIFDRWTYALTYLSCGIAGSLGSLWWHPLVIGAGASGAIFGMAGALLAALYLGNLPLPKQAIQRTLKSLLMFAGYNLFFGAVGAGIDNSAHIGGLLAGLLLGSVLAKRLTAEPEVRKQWRLYVFLAMALLLLAGTSYVKQKNGYVAKRDSASRAFDRGDFKQAINDLQIYTPHAPDDPVGFALMGASYLELRQYQPAEQALKRALTISPTYAYAEYMLGLLYDETGRYDESHTILAKLVAEHPKEDNSLVLLGHSLENLGRDGEAIATYRQAIAANPNNPRAQILLGRLQLKAGDKQDALSSLKEAARLDPQNASTQHDLAHAYAAQGMTAEAAAAMQKAVELERDQSPPK